MPDAYRFATVEDQALLGDARAWRERAARLLEASDLPVLLREHGRIVFSGSYAYDTMMSPDIDLHLLLNAFSRHGAVEVLDALIHQDWWNTYTFGDWVQERFRATVGGRAPKGYLLKLGATFEGRYWNVDAWVLDHGRYAGDLWAPKMAAITGEQRLAILRLKRARAVGALRSPGVDIYEAVVDHDVTTPEAFLAWQAANRSAE